MKIKKSKRGKEEKDEKGLEEGEKCKSFGPIAKRT